MIPIPAMRTHQPFADVVSLEAGAGIDRGYLLLHFDFRVFDEARDIVNEPILR